MPITLGKLAQLIEAEVPSGHDDQEIVGIKSLIEAGEGDISFYSSDKYKDHLDQTKASAVILNKSQADIASYKWIPLTVADVPLAMSKVLSYFSSRNNFDAVIQASAIIDPKAKVGNDVHIGHHVIIEAGAEIGEGVVLMGNNYIGKSAKIAENTILYPGANVMESCIVGKSCVIQSNTVIGSDGFGYVFVDNKYRKIPHIGNVELEDEVEIGANCTIDRASIGTTRIKKGAKLDNLIQIAHNVEIGEHTALAAQVGIAGSSKIGDFCQIGGQVGIAGHLTIADQTKIQAQSGIGGNVKEVGSKLYGSPALDYNNYLRSYAGFKNLPELIKKIKDLEQKISSLQSDDESKNNSKTNQP